MYKVSYHCARLYNVGLYSVRQYFFDNDEYLPYGGNYHACKGNENYRLLLSDTAQQILRIVDRDMKSFFGLLKAKSQGFYSAQVKLPHYKKKEAVSTIFVQGRSARIRDGYVHVGFSAGFKQEYEPSFKTFRFKLPKHIAHIEKLRELRIIPVFGGKEFDIEFVYEKEPTPQGLNPDNHLSIDLGLDNFATCFNSTSGASFIIDGRYIKSINQWYNKCKAELQSMKDKQGYTHMTNRMFRLERKRTNQINDYMNRSVKHITDYCIENDIGTIVVGDFSAIKQNINIGKRNNQNFVAIPYGKFRQKLKSKCEQLGIIVEHHEESYTSKTSFLDKEEPVKHESYAGRRIKRGLFRASDGRLINADLNGAAQILVKHFLATSKPKALDSLYGLWSSGGVTSPVRINVCPSKSP